MSDMTVGGDAGEVVEDVTYWLYQTTQVMGRLIQMGMCGQDLVCKRRVTIGS